MVIALQCCTYAHAPTLHSHACPSHHTRSSPPQSDDEPLIDASQYLSSSWHEAAVSYTQRDLLTYAVGIGCDELRYVWELDCDFAAFPTYPIVLEFKGTSHDVVSFPSPTMMESPVMAMPPLPGTRVILDGERYIEKLSELDESGCECILKSKLVGVHARRSGASIEMESLLTEAATGKPLYRFLSSSFMVGAKGFTGAGKEHFAAVKPPKGVAPDAVEEIATAANQTALYRLSGDYNPLHVDPEFAQMSGFAEPILHGLCSLGVSARAVLRRFGENDASQFRAIKVRFSKPVLPGQTLRVEMWRADGPMGKGTRIIFRTLVKETGKVCITNAFCDLNGAAKL